MRYAAALRVSKNASMVLLGSVLRMAFAFAFVIYAARYLGVEGFGKFALSQQLFDLFLSLSATGLGILVTRETAKDSTWLGRNLIAAIAIVVILSVGGGLLLAILTQFAGYAQDTKLAICIAAVALVPAGICALAEAVFVAWEKAEYVAFGTGLESLLRTGLCFLALWMGYGLLSLFVVLIVARLALLFLYSVLLWRELPAMRWRLETGPTVALLCEWRVFAAENWLSTLYLQLDVVLLSLFHGEAAVGIYEAAWKLIRLGSVVARSFTTAVFPFISRLYVRAEDTFHQVNLHSVKYFLAAILPVVIGTAIFAERIVLLLFDHEYVGAVPVLQVLAWLMIPQFLNPFLSHILFARGRQRQSLIVAAVALSTFVIAALWVIPQWGAVGTAYVALLSATAAFCCYMIFCVRGYCRIDLLAILLRQSVAAGVLCAILYLMKSYDLLFIVLVGAMLYPVLLVALRIVTWSDFKLLQELH
jgi:O-antigen/teichoic acid export membrane protein